MIIKQVLFFVSKFFLDKIKYAIFATTFWVSQVKQTIIYYLLMFQFLLIIYFD